MEGWQALELSDTFIYPDKSVDLAPFFWAWQLPKGLYTFDIQVIGAAPYDRDNLRSNAVIIPHLEARLVKIGLTTRAGVIKGIIVFALTGMPSKFLCHFTTQPLTNR